MKPQKKAVVAKKATKLPAIAKKRRALLERTMPDVKKEKKSKKLEKLEDAKKKSEVEKRKLEKIDDKKKAEEKKKSEDKKKEKLEKLEERKKPLKELEKKLAEKKVDRTDEKEPMDDAVQDLAEKKKPQKVEEKGKCEKQNTDTKKKAEKVEEKKKSEKLEEENHDEPIKETNASEEKNVIDRKPEHFGLTPKKRYKEEKKKEAKQIKLDSKEVAKVSVPKDRKPDRKKPLDKDAVITKAPPLKTKKESKGKSTQKKTVSRKTVLAKKPPLTVVKKLVDKKIKLVKSVEDEDTSPSEEDDNIKKTKKKHIGTCKTKVVQEKRPRIGKQAKSKLPQKTNKVNLLPKKEEKSKPSVEKIGTKKKLDVRDTEKPNSEQKKTINKEESILETEVSNVKNEIVDDSEVEKLVKDEASQLRSQDVKKLAKTLKPSKKLTKKSSKTVKVQIESTNQIFTIPKDASFEECGKQSKISEEASKETAILPQEELDAENTIRIDLKVETINGESLSDHPTSSESEDDSDIDMKRNKSKDIKKTERGNSPSDERARRMRLFGFWSGPKRHRVASLNALAKVHCLYENETGGVYLGGFCKPKPEKEKQRKTKEEKEEQQPKKEKEKKLENKTDENVPKRKLRNVRGLRGKHWEMLESSSSSSSSDDESERVNEKNVEHNRKKIIKRRKKNEEVMDLKDMVVCKRMASLNASAILAASYSDEKNRHSSSSDSSSESEVEIIKRRKQNDSDVEKRKSRQGSEGDEVLKPSNKLVILNQDTDVTITGVYVNQTRSTHHEGFCSIAGMQYRISSTSHTQTAATAVATELHDQQKPEQPCKSYTPLGALSSMQPPGSQGNHPNMSPRRHSAFSAPHQHGYYQPAGPLIQHPPTLPPVKGPPPEPTPTPPQNSEGSDDLVATSTTSGGTSSTGGGFYRAYCPQYYGTPPQYPDLCYPPTYSHPHAHPPPYYKYAPAYRRQYYGYQESGGGGGPGGGGTGGGPGVVDYQAPPPPPGEYPLPPYYGGYPPPPPPPLPPPNPAYLHSQGRPFVDHAAFQGCPCPMQSCPKNVDTGPLIGNGKGAPVISGPGLSLPPSALVGPPSPARGLAGLAPPHGANAWDTDRVQLNTHRNLNQNQPSVPPSSHNLVGGHNRPQNSDRRSKDEKSCTEEKLRKCGCQKHACTSTCEVKMESLSPSEKLSVGNCPSSKYHNFKIENNNVKCESCSVEMGDSLSCVANCNVKCETDFKCGIMTCEQCLKEGHMAILEIDKDSGILLDDKIETDTDVKEELNDVMVIDSENWKKPDYEPTVPESVDEQIEKDSDDANRQDTEQEEQPKCQKLTKRKLSLDSLSDCRKKRKVSKRTLSVGSSQDLNKDSDDSVLNDSASTTNSSVDEQPESTDESSSRKKQTNKKDNQSHSSNQGQIQGHSQTHSQNETQDQNQSENQNQSQSQAYSSQSQNQIQTESQVQNDEQGNAHAQSHSYKRKAEHSHSGESLTSKSKSSFKQNASNGLTNCMKHPASDSSIMETINNVIQQSLQMTRKKDRKNKNQEKSEKKKKSSNLMSTVKKVAKKVDLVKELASEKFSKLVTKNSYSKSKIDIKIKSQSKKQDCKSKSMSKKKYESKLQDIKPKLQGIKIKDTVKSGKQENVVKCKVTNDINEVAPKKPALIKKKRKSVKKAVTKKSATKQEDVPTGCENLTLTRKTFLKPKWSNGWSWEGDPFEAKVYLTNEESAIRRCYASMRHESGDVLRPRDCVLLKSGPRKADLPFVAKIAALWENPDDGEMMFSLLWYYRPEHTEQGRTQYDTEDEVFASRHRDANSVACIEDKCYILTFNEYCRYRKNLRRIEEGLESPGLIVPPGDQIYPRENRQPPIPVPSDMVLFCRRVYDYRGKKLVKNPG